MKNLHLFPTDKDSNLFIGNLSGQLHFNYSIEKGSSRNQHIYITSDKEIKDCWVLNTHTNQVYFLKGFYGIQPIIKKIILTTDTDLIANGVQAVDDSFLEWFVNNPSCGWVEVQDWVHYYKIFIPKEEPCTCKKHDPYCCQVHGMCPTCVKKEEPKQEYEYIGECRGNNGKGCFMDSCGHDCGCYVRIPKQESTNPTLHIADVNKRFFFFTYAYWCDKSEGKGTLSLTSTIGFPTQKDVKQKAIEHLKNRYDEPEYKISVVIESWIEMSEDDYNQWVS